MSKIKDNYQDQVVGAILAGGRSSRMGGQDKSQLLLGGVSLINHVVSRTQSQVSKLIINGPSNKEFSKLGLPVVEDSIAGFPGPLAGVLAAMRWTYKNVPDARWLATFATDAPFFPNNMVEKMIASIKTKNAETAIACSAGRDHPVFALWPMSVKDELSAAIKNDGLRRVGQWFESQNVVRVDFPIIDIDGANGPDGIDPFLNINTPDDLALAKMAESLLPGYSPRP